LEKGVLIVILLVLATMIFASSAYAKAQYYPVTVSKVQSNLYLDKKQNIYIQTRNCYLSAYNKPAILSLDKTIKSNNYIMFQDSNMKYQLVNAWSSK